MSLFSTNPKNPKNRKMPSLHSDMHLNEEEMVSYLDGELDASRAVSLRTHLESCWQCRSRLHQVQESIGAFLRSREAIRPEAENFPETPVEQFRQRLAHHATAWRELHPVWSAARLWQQATARLRLSTHFVVAHKQASVAALVAVAIFVVAFSDQVTTASAETILLRAQSFESHHEPASGQVGLASVQVESVDRKTNTSHALGTIAWIHDSSTAAASITAEAATATSVGLRESTILKSAASAGWMPHWMTGAEGLSSQTAQYLVQRHWLPSVSVAEFRKLIEGRGVTTTSVDHVGNAYTVHYPFADHHVSGIAEALLSVRAQDYEPVSISIITSANAGSATGAAGSTVSSTATRDPYASREYRFTQLASTVAPRTPELARLFDEPSRTPTIPDTEAATLATPRITPLSYLQTPPAEVEIAAVLALHKVDACMGEEISVFPMSDGSVMVQGLVDKAERRDVIRRALSSIPGALRVRIYTPAEIHNASELYTSPDGFAGRSPASPRTTAMNLADLSSEQMPLYVPLMAHFSAVGTSSVSSSSSSSSPSQPLQEDAQNRLAAFSNELVNAARQTLLHAWALKKLDHEFPAERERTLSAASVAQLDQVRRDHRRWIAILSRRQAEMLSQVGIVPATSKTSIAPDPDSEALLRQAEAENDLVRSLFTVSPEAIDTNVSLTRLVTLLRQLGG